MIKLILFVKRKPGMSAQAFREYYETTHAPLAMNTIGQWLVGYTRHYLLAVPNRPEPPCDCITELCYRDRAALEASIAWTRTEEGQVLRRDEVNFMDSAAMVSTMADSVSSAF